MNKQHMNSCDEAKERFKAWLEHVKNIRDKVVYFDKEKLHEKTQVR